MCTGMEIAALVSAAATTYSAVSASSSKPAPVMGDPAADAARAADLASQDAAKAKLESRRRMRANSLLSAYSDDDPGKATLGA